ncbi:MAG: SDR family oxidoreductase [Pyrinomonadaceae bacterium]
MTMKFELKKLGDQVVVITGASSGIGLATARLAAKRGARLVLAARSQDALRQLCDEINTAGGAAIYVVADVGREADVQRIADEARRRFGGFDTWINDAGVSIYGKLLEVSDEDSRRLFETNFWGVVYGSRAAARHLKGRGGALINVGSTVSDRAIPVQGMYSASKHAVKGFTDALRMELEAEGAPISVTLIKPGAIDTPFTHHAMNYLEREPSLPPPVYDAQVVAEAILHCAEHPVRDMFAGGGGKMMSASGHYAPRATDKLMEATMFELQKSDRPGRPREQNGLHRAGGGLRESGGYEGHVSKSSAYTKAAMHPLLSGAIMVGAGLALAAWLMPARANGSVSNGHSTEVGIL